MTAAYPATPPAYFPDGVTIAGPVVEAPRARRRVDLLALVRRPSRTTQREQLLDRYRWTVAGLRERLRLEVTSHDLTLTAIEVLADDTARELGHAHPVVVVLRAVAAEGRDR